MKGDTITQHVKDLFQTKWLEIKNKHPGKRPKAKYVLEAVKQQLTIEKKSYLLPKLRTAQLLCSNIYENFESQSQPEKSLDEEWTMAKMKELREYELPAYSLPAVVKIWRYAANMNEKFTIRQAQWVSRLYSMPTLDNVTLLWWCSLRYSFLEQLASINKEPFDTYVPDISLFLGKWERDTLDRTNYHPEPMKFQFRRILPPKKDSEYILELLHSIPHWHEEDTYNERNQTLYKLIRKLPSLKSLGFEEETKFVYMRWFTSYITKGPKWNDLSPEDALNVIVELRKLILEEQEFRKSEDFTQSISVIFDLPSQPLKVGMRKLLQKVGYKFAQKPEHEMSPEEEKFRQELRNKLHFKIVRNKEE